MSETRPSNDRDERIKSMSSWRKALIRPELGGICGTILVFIFFMLTAFDSGMFGGVELVCRVCPIYDHSSWCVSVDDCG